MLMVFGSGIAAAADDYRLMLSAREDSVVDKDVFVVGYDSFDDLLNSPPAGGPGAFSGIDIAGSYIASGLAYDGKYRLMLSAREDSGVGRDVFVVTYDSFDDLLNSPPAGGPGAFSGIDIAGSYIASGLAYQPPQAIPEPGTLAMLSAGLVVLALARRRRSASS